MNPVRKNKYFIGALVQSGINNTNNFKISYSVRRSKGLTRDQQIIRHTTQRSKFRGEILTPYMFYEELNERITSFQIVTVSKLCYRLGMIQNFC